jgi:molybdenum-dependent DNA-binding transcriptional regulator ModE
MNKHNKKTRYKGIVADAKQLGVTYQHLWQVLEGRRESRSLLDRYRALKEQQKAEVCK